jgi:hypothetical protein
MLPTRLGWFGAVAYALPILEVWLLTRLSDEGTDVVLVALQVLWVIALLAVLDRCLRGSKAYRAAADARADEAAREAEREAIAIANSHTSATPTPAAPLLGPDGHVAQRPRTLRPRTLRSSADRRRSHR